MSQLQAAEPTVTSTVQGSSVLKFFNQAVTFGVPLNGQVAFTSQTVGFIARPFFPDGISNTPPGPFSKQIAAFSPFNTGLQTALVKPALARLLTGGTPLNGNRNCSPIPGDVSVGAGLMIFSGGTPLYKNGRLVGAIGVSGDGILQDNQIAAAGAFGLDAPAAIRADQVMVQGLRLVYNKFDRNPNIAKPPQTPLVIPSARVFANGN
jgi:hypothetical protein